MTINKPTRYQAKGNTNLLTSRGVSLLETMISTLLVGVILVASMKTVGAVMQQRNSTTDDQQAVWLAQELLAEILEKEYADPHSTSPTFGPEETGSRHNYNDVDDFHTWNKKPPEQRDGTPLNHLAGWRRRVVVEYVDPDNPAIPLDHDAGVKRITVNVYKNGRLLSRLQSLRSTAWFAH
ncbi:MAG: hypothetical protein MK161_14040 [Pirellulales bacterium]|nr:hypothetical protein [Pirellulales bacterium]